MQAEIIHAILGLDRDFWITTQTEKYLDTTLIDVVRKIPLNGPSKMTQYMTARSGVKKMGRIQAIVAYSQKNCLYYCYPDISPT